MTWSALRDGTRALAADGATWWGLLESTAEATAADVVAFLEAAHSLVPWTEERLWEPLFDPLAHVYGVACAWRATTEPLRSSLGWGLARAGRIPASELPAGTRERIATECVRSEERPSLASDLARADVVWPRGLFRRALLEAALATHDPLPSSVVEDAVVVATPDERIALRLRASRADATDALGPPLRDPDPEEREALRSLVTGWSTGAVARADPISRFRACELLLQEGDLDLAEDALLPEEMFTWASDLASPGCGLCGSESEATDTELPLRVVRLLARLPHARREEVLVRAERAGVIRDASLLRGWLDRDPHAHLAAARDHGSELADLPASMRGALGLAWSRLAVAPDGHLPRLLQREVRAAWGPVPAILGPESAARACAARPELARLLAERGGFLVVDPEQPLGDEARVHAEARMRRLVELGAPLPVLFAEAHGLRHAQAQPAAGWGAVRHVPTDRDACRGWLREVALSLLVARRLAGAGPQLAAVIASLERARDGQLDTDGAAALDAAAALEAAWDAAPHDPEVAAGHHAACALDQALQLGCRTDQDDLDDIGERAFVLARAARHRSAVDDARLTEERRAWWTWWLLEAAPEAFRSLDPPAREA